ncbi:DedA family protein [Sulfitobacter sp. S0837]|uniref:YqaA family protein n=1 Tax=Sulfitobacter maritimus TaxID=2741719 RepID=UPI0015840437|nr:YqaA family protein [Sulfitobacter maritimus]NUH67169.1 DedA family protein [Sulfitobacter maritimus]
MLALSSLFAAAFFAATLIPAQSEAVLLGLIWADAHPVALLLLVATAGNVLGSVVNWLLGGYLAHVAARRWFPFSSAQVQRASQWYQRWGYWSLLASWMPIIGDPLTLAAGVLKEPLWRFLVIVTIAKGGRYLLLAAAALNYL